jgi:hypothetical protein
VGSEYRNVSGLPTPPVPPPLSPAQILARLLTVDGSGSGLDADLLDGLSSAAFASATMAVGGDLSGNLPNPAVAKVAGVTPSAYILTLLDDAAASNARTTLGLGTIAIQDANAVSISGGSIAGITDLAVADGGTGASTAGAARTNLGLGNSATKDVGTGSGDVAAGDHLHTGVYQPLDADLTALAGLTSAADKLPYFTGAGTAAVADFTAAGRALVDDADASAQRTTLGLGTMATQGAGAVDIDGGTIDGTVIGGTTKAAGSFTDGVFTGTINAGGSGASRSKITGSSDALQLIVSDASGSSVPTVLYLDHASSVAATPGFGLGMNFCGRTDSGSGSPNVPLATLEAVWSDATSATRKSVFHWGVYDVSTVRNGVSLAAISGGVDIVLIEAGNAGTVKINSGLNYDGSGAKHARVSTGSIAGGASSLVTITWATAFADANYTVQVAVQDSTVAAASLSVVHVESVSASAITVRVANAAVGAITGTLHAVAFHD